MTGTADGNPAAVERWQRVEEAFTRLAEIPAEEREPQLLELFPDEPGMRHEVRAMLEAHGAGESSPLERRLLADDAAEADDPRIGTDLGPYRLLDVLGRGGMGVVYRAERRDDEYQQEVAIKMLRTGWLGSDALDRFRLERQLLARLQHPNVATLLDGGMTDDGLPYLVMQKVEGTPITRYCDENRLPVRARLRLFGQVCDAVAFAHRNLIVHRDLKPSNILVDANGQVQLLDFGIAKLLDAQSLGLDPKVTRTEQRVLTPLHSAPEQLSGEAVTTATDVYALGLLLYELLSGRFPYRVADSSPGTVEGAVRRTAPLSLAEALRTSTDDELAPGRTDHLAVEEIAARRATGTRRLDRELRGDLARIAAMALRQEPERRYPSAAQLAEDVDRYLRGDTVSAHADSLAYRARRFFARNRAASMAALLLVGLGAAFTAYALVQAERLREERDRLVVEQERSEAVTRTLVDLLKSAAPETAQGDTVSIADFLAAADQTAEGMADRPAVQARLLFALGEMRAVRGEKAQARDFFDRAWALEQQIGESDTAFGQQVFHSLALMNLQMGEVGIGREQMRASLDWHRRRYGELHTDVAQVMTDLSRYVEPGEAVGLLDRALEIRRQILPDEDLGIASTLNGLARLYADLGDRARARDHFADVLQRLEAVVGTGHPNYLIVRGNWASQLASAEEKLAVLDAMLPQSVEVFGPRSVIVAGLHDYRGEALARLGELEAASEAHEAALELATAAGGPTVLQATRAAANLGSLHLATGDSETAARFFHAAASGSKTERRRAEMLSLEALSLSRHGSLEQALRRSSTAVELARVSATSAPGDTSADIVLAGNLLRHGEILMDLERAEEALAVLTEAQPILDAASGAPTQVVTGGALALGRAQIAVGREAEGKALLESALIVAARTPLIDPAAVKAATDALRRSP